MDLPGTISRNYLNMWVDNIYSILGVKAINGLAFNDNNGFPEGSSRKYYGRLNCYTAHGQIAIYGGVYRGHIARYGPFYEIDTDSLPECPLLLSSHPKLDGPYLFKVDADLPIDIDRDLRKGHLRELAITSEHTFGILFGGEHFSLAAIFSTNMNTITDRLDLELPEWDGLVTASRLHVVGGKDQCWRVLLQYSREKVGIED